MFGLKRRWSAFSDISDAHDLEGHKREAEYVPGRPNIRISLTICEIADREPLRRFRNISQRYIWMSFSDHQMDDYQGLIHDRPCRVPQPQLKSTENFGDSGLAAMSRGEDGLDIF